MFEEDTKSANGCGPEEEKHKKGKVYKVRIDNEVFRFEDPIITGRQLLRIAGKKPINEHLIYQRLKNGQFEEIRLDETVDLCSPGLERFKTFESGESYRFVIDDERYEWGAPEITGLTLKRIVGVDPTFFDVWLSARGQEEDQLIADNESVRLDEPGVERFYTAEINITVIINGRPREIDKRTLSFSEIVSIAFPGVPTAPNIAYTVVYKNGPVDTPEGSLVEGQSVNIKERMIINVSKTDKS